ncbi:hypothetical protein [uncultured Draconibacterium sp.]|uniref:NUDIX hydrolase n=1 Tax=uncultured Draconibacterium sp. TaxID=1573823 RepID=UPI002AA5E2F6|nr:hypothetical protein [uncultured Draconibacterium sp.]
MADSNNVHQNLIPNGNGNNNPIKLGASLKDKSLQGVVNEIFKGFFNSKENILINDTKDLIDLIIKTRESKDYIGVGVGGLYVNNKDEVLVYYRTDSPEKHKWSIIGGSGTYRKDIETTLREKFQTKANIPLQNVDVIALVRVTNHTNENSGINNNEGEFHFLSPAYIIDITNCNERLNEIPKLTKKKDIQAPKTSGSSERFICRFVKINKIQQYPEFFTYTTRAAVQSYQREKNNIHHIIERIDNISSYIKEVPKIKKVEWRKE